jgi:hypothetical protein
MYVCMYVLYAFRHRTSQCSQNLHGITLGPEEVQDEVRAPEGGWEISPQFLKIFGEFNPIFAVHFSSF